jgi:hypothetical protein
VNSVSSLCQYSIVRVLVQGSRSSYSWLQLSNILASSSNYTCQFKPKTKRNLNVLKFKIWRCFDQIGGDLTWGRFDLGAFWPASVWKLLKFNESRGKNKNKHGIVKDNAYSFTSIWILKYLWTNLRNSAIMLTCYTNAKSQFFAYFCD